MRTGRPITPLSLAVEERESLENWARRPTSAQALAQRARIVLECAAGNPHLAVARKLRSTPLTVGKWRQRFLDRRLDGLLDEPRPGAPRQVGDAQIERVVLLTLESTPGEATHWSTRALARRSGLSQSTVGRIWVLACSRIGSRGSSFPRTPCLSSRYATSWACISIRRIRHWCWAWTRRPRFRHSIGVSR